MPDQGRLGIDSAAKTKICLADIMQEGKDSETITGMLVKSITAASRGQSSVKGGLCEQSACNSGYVR